MTEPRRLSVRVVPLFEAGPRALAWTHYDGVLWVRWPFHRVFWSVARIAHEVWHNVTGKRNEDHAPFWSFRVTAKNAVRLVWDVPAWYRRVAERLRDGETVDPDDYEEAYGRQISS